MHRSLKRLRLLTELTTPNARKWLLAPLTAVGLLASSACAQEADDQVVGEEAVEADSSGLSQSERLDAMLEARRASPDYVSAEDVAQELAETAATMELELISAPDQSVEARRAGEARVQAARERAAAARERADAARQALEDDD